MQDLRESFLWANKSHINKKTNYYRRIFDCFTINRRTFYHYAVNKRVIIYHTVNIRVFD